MDFHRARADGKVAGDFLVGTTRAQQFENFPFAAAEKANRVLSLHLAPAALRKLAGFTQDDIQMPRKAAHLERQDKVIYRPGLHRFNNTFDRRGRGDKDHRQPNPHVTQRIEHNAGRYGRIVIRSQQNTLFWRTNQQLIHVGINFSMMTEGEGNTRLFSPRSTVTTNDM